MVAVTFLATLQEKRFIPGAHVCSWEFLFFSLFLCYCSAIFSYLGCVLLVKIFIEGVLKNSTGQCKKIMPAILCLSKERTLINNCGILQKWVILLWQVVCYNTYLWWYKSVSLV